MWHSSLGPAVLAHFQFRPNVPPSLQFSRYRFSEFYLWLVSCREFVLRVVGKSGSTTVVIHSRLVVYSSSCSYNKVTPSQSSNGNTPHYYYSFNPFISDTVDFVLEYSVFLSSIAILFSFWLYTTFFLMS